MMKKEKTFDLLKLKSNPDNPRTITRDKLEKLKKSISSFHLLFKNFTILFCNEILIIGQSFTVQINVQLCISNLQILRFFFFIFRSVCYTQACQSAFLVLSVLQVAIGSNAQLEETFFSQAGRPLSKTKKQNFVEGLCSQWIKSHHITI